MIIDCNAINGIIFGLAFALTSFLKITDDTAWTKNKKAYIACFLGFAILILLVTALDYFYNTRNIKNIKLPESQHCVSSFDVKKNDGESTLKNYEKCESKGPSIFIIGIVGSLLIIIITSIIHIY